MSRPRPYEVMADPRRLKAATIAVLLSVAFHAVLYKTLGERPLAFLEPLLAASSRPERREAAIRVESLPAVPLARLADPLTDLFEGTPERDAAALVERLSQPSAATVFEPPPAAVERLTAAGLDTVAPPPVPELPAWQPRQEILQILEHTARDAIAPLPRREIPLIERQPVAPDITRSYDLLEGLTAVAGNVGALPALTTPIAVEMAPTDLPTGGSEAWPEPRLGAEAEGETATSLMAEIPAAVAPAYPIEDRLRLDVTTYRPSRGATHRYFRIDVHRKDEVTLPRMPKDIVFVQDTSRSMADRALRPSVEALRAAVGSIHPQDRFNILRFETETTRCFEDWAAPTPANIERAGQFLDAMSPTGLTDLFQSMLHVLALPREPDRPLIAVVITDGHVTAGQVERDTQIIGTFSRLNAGDLSVFTVAVSPRSNTYLLDMLSFSNRGGHTAVAPSRFRIRQTVAELIASLQQPLLGDVRFNFDTVSDAEVYPTLTTSLYYDRPLQLFGRVPAEHRTVAFQARGRSGDARYDMLFEVDLEDPEAQPGDAGLASQWAVQRMYDLVARFARTEDPALIADMQLLGAQYRVPIPYRSRIVNPPPR